MKKWLSFQVSYFAAPQTVVAVLTLSYASTAASQNTSNVHFYFLKAGKT